MSEIRTRSREMMSDFYGITPQLGAELQPLERRDAFEKITLLAQLSKYLPAGERSRLIHLLPQVISSRKNATDGIKETEAGAYLARKFGDPRESMEILDQTTAEFERLMGEIETSAPQAELWLREADFSLEDLADEIERSVFPLIVIQIKALEDKKKRFEASRQSLQAKRSAGKTAESRREDIRDAHDEELVKMDKELKEATTVLGLWFELTQSLKTQQLATRSTHIPDPMAVREQIVFSGSGGSEIQ